MMDDFSLFAGTTNRIGEMIEIFQQGLPESEHKGSYLEGDVIQFDHVTIKTPSDTVLIEGTK